MRPVATEMTEVDNLAGEEVEFSISDARWVMRSMADLYSNRELAVVREYSTNARDAMIESGYADEPIVVSLPNQMNPYFSVQDFGIGMSETDLKETYTQFGNSTKRESDEFNGMLGFGSKSAVAYTNTFTVTAIKNGLKTIAVITRKEDYSIVLKIVMSGIQTSERNGVTIQVPVHNHQEFERKARDFYRFWKPGTVLVNGKQPDWAVGDKIADNLFYYPSDGESFVVMGNVAYKIANPDALFPRGMRRISFVAYVDNGAVEFTPSREALKYSEHTKRNLHSIINDFSNTAIQTAKDEVLAATSAADAFNAWYKWTNVIGAENCPDLTYKGVKLVNKFVLTGMRYCRSYNRGNTHHVNSWNVTDMPNTMIVTDFQPTLASGHKAKARQYMDLKNISGTFVIFTQAKTVDCHWVEPDRMVSWNDLKKALPAPPKKTRAAQSIAWGRKAGSFDIITQKGRKAEQDVPQVQDLYFVTVQEYNRDRSLEYGLKEFDLDYQVVLVPANRMAKFNRCYPEAKPIIPLLKSMVVLGGNKLISKEGMEFLSLSSSEITVIKSLKEHRINDPEIKRLIALVKNQEDKYLVEYDKHYRLANILGLGHNFIKHSYARNWDRKGTPFTSTYPLASNIKYSSADVVEQIYFYMECLYKARKEGLYV